MKILFTDLDGTLFNKEKKVSSRLRLGLQTMLDNGHILVLASGRPLKSIIDTQSYLKLTSDNLYISAFNGAMLYHCGTQTLLQNQVITNGDALRIVDLALENNLHIQTYQDNRIVAPHDSRELAYYTRSVLLETLISHPISNVLHCDVSKLIAINLDHKESLEAFSALLTKEIGTHITTSFSNPSYLEIFSANAGKGKSVTFLRDYFHLTDEDTYAVGDAENDLSMLHAAGTGCAVSNATKTVKAAADYILSCSNEEDGVFELLEHFGFLTLND